MSIFFWLSNYISKNRLSEMILNPPVTHRAQASNRKLELNLVENVTGTKVVRRDMRHIFLFSLTFLQISHSEIAQDLPVCDSSTQGRVSPPQRPKCIRKKGVGFVSASSCIHFSKPCGGPEYFSQQTTHQLLFCMNTDTILYHTKWTR